MITLVTLITIDDNIVQHKANGMHRMCKWPRGTQLLENKQMGKKFCRQESAPVAGVARAEGRLERRKPAQPICQIPAGRG